MHVIAAKAVALKEALSEGFRIYQKATVSNAVALASHLTARGITLVSGGTDNHMMLIDLRSIPITGKEAEAILGRAGMTVNKNAVPFDDQSPLITSGIRIGTPAVTTRGMSAPEMKIIADLIVDVLTKGLSDKWVIERSRETVRALCKAFPIYSP
jgi:glycine hydroxymethyltransferase